MLRFPWLHCSSMKFMSNAPGMAPEVVRPRNGSPYSGCSTLMTSAPHSPSSTPPEGANHHWATSTTFTPRSTSCIRTLSHRSGASLAPLVRASSGGQHHGAALWVEPARHDRDLRALDLPVLALAPELQ